MPTKSIAIPPNLRGRPDRDRRAAAKALATTESGVVAELASEAPRAARPVQLPPSHRYRIGERLRMGQGGHTIARAASFCKVISLLPYEGYGALQYRVRSDSEQFERIVAEADLSRHADGP